MGEKTGISWTDATFNPWIGCKKVSPGCANCYAEVGPAAKFKGVKWGPGQQRVRTSESNWNLPLRWNRKAAAAGVRTKVFCASLADWLDPEVPAEWLSDLLGLIDATPNLKWQLLTKRPELWRERMEAVRDRWAPVAELNGKLLAGNWLTGTAPMNVWVGTTVEDQRRADERIPALLSIPAKVQFLSMEPQLEAVQIPLPFLYYKGAIQWVIIGGESGHKARPFNLGWARSIVKQCKDAGVAVFVKQMGDLPVNPLSMSAGGEGLRLPAYKAHHGADPSEWPVDLRLQEFPEVPHV